MRILILRSVLQTERSKTRDAYNIRLDTNYVNRFLAHFTGQDGYCHACAKTCQHCRRNYLLDFSNYLVGIISFPAYLPVLLEDADELLPANVPPHDVLIAISVHEEIILSFLKKFPHCRALIVPQEAPSWLSPYGRRNLTAYCESRQLEWAFPKPFCSFAPANGLLLEFQNTFRIGKPQVKFDIKDNQIQAVKVLISAPCGATYFTARKLQGQILINNHAFTIGKALSCFPCTASTEIDPDYNDSLMHKAAHLQHDILSNL